MHIRHDDERLTWAGAVSVEHTAAWSQAWRLPHERIGLFPPEMLQERAAHAAGVRLTFTTDSTAVAGEIEPQDDISPLDCYVNGERVGTAHLHGQERFAFAGLPPGEKRIEVWLPQFGLFRLRGLSLDDGASLTRADETRPRWLTYGSSITQCRTAASPAQTWPAIAARALDLHLTCLGFGGQCHLDPMIALLIRDTPADLFSMCVGINIHGGNSLNLRTFRPAILGFVRIVREKHPDTPFIVMSPIYGVGREIVPNAVGFTLPEMRAEVAAAVETLRAHGDAHIHYLDGLAVFGADLARHLPDDLHPDAEGYRIMGERMASRLGHYITGQ